MIGKCVKVLIKILGLVCVRLLFYVKFGFKVINWFMKLCFIGLVVSWVLVRYWNNRLVGII